MIPDAGNLQEVEVMVNTGYQSIARERSAGAIAKPDMDIVKKRFGSISVIQRLDGLIPGLVINNSTSPTGNLINGKRSLPVMIRELTTISDFTNRDPLFVVNGILVTDINSVDLNDVKRHYNMKDPTSACIWGSRAANGIIVLNFRPYRNRHQKQEETRCPDSLPGKGENPQPGKKQDWLQAIEKEGLTWTQLSDLEGWKNAASTLYDARGIPANFLIDPQEKIVEKDLREKP